MTCKHCIFPVLLFLGIGVYGQSSNIGQFSLRGLAWEDDTYHAVPLKPSYFRPTSNFPARHSIKEYAPRVINQANSNTSVAWSAVWYARTMQDAIRNNVKDTQEITGQAFSPLFNYRSVATMPGCEEPVKLSAVLESLHSEGAVPFSSFREFCVDSISPGLYKQAEGNKMPGYVRLFYTRDPEEKKVNTIKEAIAEDHPVVLGMIAPLSFSLAGEFWQPRVEPDREQGGHAVTVVGYDDTIYGGAIEVVNSWGSGWGNDGYTWILYSDVEKFVQYGYELLDTKVEVELNVNLSLVTSERESMIAERVRPGHFELLKSYPTGTKFSIQLSMDQPAFLYVIGFDKDWNHGQFYPSEASLSPWRPEGFGVVSLPQAGFIELFDPPGKNYLCFLVSGRELPIDEIIASIKKERASFFEGRSDDKSIWMNNQMTFSIPLQREAVLSWVVEFDQIKR